MWRIELALDEGSTAHFGIDLPDGHGSHQLVDMVEGRSSGPPTHAVFAQWVVDDPSLASAFEESRRELFGLRRTHIDSFVSDLLLRPTAAEAVEYVVLGAYGDADGLALARNHPAIVEWARSHPAERLAARDVTGMRTGLVTQWERS